MFPDVWRAKPHPDTVYKGIGLLALRSAVLTLGKAPVIILQETRDLHRQSVHEGEKKNLHNSAVQDGTRYIQSVAKYIAT